MNEENFAALFDEGNIRRSSLHPGDRIVATVAAVSGENIFLDIGRKSEGVLKAAEFTDKEGGLTVEAGDQLEVFFVGQRSGEMIFTTRLGSGRASMEELEDAYQAGIPIEGKVVAEIKGGFEIRVAGQRAFCPYSQMDVRRIEDPSRYLDQTLSFRVMEIGANGRNIIVSARSILEEQRQKQREELEKTLEPGMRMQGTVTSVRTFGAFVDIGGVDGLIPVSEMAWGQVENPQDLVETGQQVEVVIKNLDWDRERITLSLRETTENPWSQAVEKYTPGSIHLGTISRLAAFGAFVTLEPGIDGLLHISKLGAGRRINHPREVVEAGQEITVRIEDVDGDARRISLALEDQDARETQHSRHSHGKDRQQPETREEKPAPSRSMGTLGDLLRAQLQRKK